MFAGSGSSGSSSVFSGVYVTEEVDGVRNKESMHITKAHAHTFGGVFQHVPCVCLFHCWNFFLVKKQNFQTSDYSSQMLDDQEFQIIRHFVSGIFL